MPDSILVIGGGGFVGRGLCAALAERGHRVRAASRSVSLPPSSGIEAVNCDGRFTQQIAPLLTECDAVVHLASASTPGSTAGQPLAEIDANLRPTLALLEAMQSHPSIPLMYVSSAGSLYGESAHASFTENDAVRPRSYHGAGKIAAEQFIGAFCRQFGGSATVLRPSNIYGPGQPAHKEFGIVAHALSALNCGEPLTVWGDGSAARDYLYVDDFIALCIAVLTTPVAQGIGVVNAGSGAALSLNELFEAIEAVTGQRLARVYDRSRPVDAGRVAIDASLAEHRYDWRPVVALPDGLRRTWDWLRSFPH